MGLLWTMTTSLKEKKKNEDKDKKKNTNIWKTITCSIVVVVPPTMTFPHTLALLLQYKHVRMDGPLLHILFDSLNKHAISLFW